MKVLLMCFSSEDDYRNKLQQIREIYRPDSNIFVIQNRYDDTEIYITFNTEYNFKMPGYIKVNKKGSTIFTIDAVNELSIRETGKIDKSFVPNWNEFENCLLLIRDGELNVIPTKIREIIKIEKTLIPHL
jgi:hypothetical protein